MKKEMINFGIENKFMLFINIQSYSRLLKITINSSCKKCQTQTAALEVENLYYLKAYFLQVVEKGRT